MDKELRNKIVYLHRHGLEFRQISSRLNISIDQVWAVLDVSHNPVFDQNKFPIQLLEDWDKTRLAILRKHGGAKYREHEQKS